MPRNGDLRGGRAVRWVDLAATLWAASFSCSLAVPASAGGPPTSCVVPVVLDVEGVGGTRYTTDLTLASRASAPVAVDLDYTASPALGSSGSGRARLTLGAGEERRIDDVIAFLRSAGLPIPSVGSQGGSLRLTLPDEEATRTFTAIARTTSASGPGRAGVAYDARPVSELSALSTRLFGLRETAADRSHVAFVNAGTEALTLRVTLFSGDPARPLRKVLPDPITLGAGEWRQLSRVLSGTGIEDGWALVERIRGTAPFLAYAVVNDNGTSDGSFVGSASDRQLSDSFLLPVVVETPRWASELVLANPSSQAVEASLTYVESLGGEPGARGTAVETLRPGEQRILPGILAYLRGRGLAIAPPGASLAGTLGVTFRSAGRAVHGYALARTSTPAPAGGAYGLSYPALAPAALAADEAFVHGLRHDASVRSNLALFAGSGPGGDPVSLEVELHDGSGRAAPRTLGPFSLAPGAWKQIDGVLSLAGFAHGWARVVRRTGSGGFAAYGVVNDGAAPGAGTGDGSYLPMQVPPAAPTGATVTVSPAPIADVLPNPFKGFLTEAAEFDASTALPQTLFYADVTWRQLEPSRGSFAWEELERDWAPHLALGRRVGFRFKMADPWVAPDDDVPDWLVALGVAMRSYEIDGGRGRVPDWDDPVLLAEHDRVITALGQKYDGDPRVAWVDVGSYGIWGEWHVGGDDRLAATQASRRRILDAYLSAFPMTKLVIPFDDPFATATLAARGHGVRNDCLGHPDKNAYYLESLEAISPGLNDAIYLSGLVTGEFCGSEAGALEGTTTYFDETLAFVKKAHWSSIGPAGGSLLKPVDARQRERCEALHKALGYRLRITSLTHTAGVRPGGNLHVSATVSNDGSAPFYFPWPVELTLRDDAGRTVFATELPWDVRSWLPGTHTEAASVRLPGSLAPGRLSLALAILDPVTREPAVHLANAGKDAGLRYRLSTVDVVP